MHCGHCAQSVTEEVGAIPGVTDVRVDHASGQLVVISDTDVAFSAIEAAVDEAGYSVAAR
jgi:copper chaperone CopZ